MKIEITVSTDRQGSKVTKIVEIDDAELEDMDESERTAYIEAFAEEVVHDMYEWGWEIKGE